MRLSPESLTTLKEAHMSPADVLKAYRGAAHLLLTEGLHQSPVLTTDVVEESGVTMNMDAFLYPFNSMRVGLSVNNIDFETTPLIQRISRLHFYCGNEIWLNRDGVLGQHTSFTVPGWHDIDVVTDRQISPKIARDNFMGMQQDRLLDKNVAKWVIRFYNSYKQGKRLDQEIRLNMTAAHEIRHAAHVAQEEMAFYAALLMGEEYFGEMSLDEGWMLVQALLLKLPILNKTEREIDARIYGAHFAYRCYKEKSAQNILTIEDWDRFQEYAQVNAD